MRFLIVLFALLFAVAVFFSVSRPKSHVSRVNAMVGSSPVAVWSWNRADASFTVVLLPAEVAADSTGYGRYSLEALWKLGAIDKKGGSVAARSLTDALAIPIPWYIGEKNDQFVKVSDPISYGRQLFSFGNLFPFLLRRQTTNIPLLAYVSLSWALARARPDAVRVVDLRFEPPTASETLPDGTVREFLDTARIDAILKGRFEDEAIRAEGMTVGVYNTTNTPALGTYAARLLTGVGVLVVAVGNSEPVVDGCEVVGSSDVTQGRTARVIAELFDCTLLVSDIQERTDLRLRLGSAYAKYFLSAE